MPEHMSFASQVCPVERDWVADITAKVHDIDVERLSGGTAAPGAAVALHDVPKATGASLASIGRPRIDQAAVDAAKARFAARKAARAR